MKNINLQFVLLLLLLCSLFSCSKNNSSPVQPTPKKDYSAKFNSKLWTGAYLIDGLKIPKPMSMEFDGKGNFTMHHISFDRYGTYSLNDSVITLKFSDRTGYITAIVSDEDKLKNFTPFGVIELNFHTVELNESIDQGLTNTKWVETTGDRYIKFNDETHLYYNGESAIYERKNGLIRFYFDNLNWHPLGGECFGVLMPGSRIYYVYGGYGIEMEEDGLVGVWLRKSFDLNGN